MAKDREEMLDEDGAHMSSRERDDIMREIKLLRSFNMGVGFDGNNVVIL